MCLSDIKVTSETSTFKIYPLALSILLWHVSVRNVNDFIQSLSTQTSLNSKEEWTGNAERDGKVWECRFFCQLLYPAWPWESDTFKSLFKSGGTDHLHTLLHRPQAQFSQATGYRGSRWLPNDSSHVRQLAPHNKKWNVQLISVVYNSYFYQLKPPFEMLRTLFAIFLSKAQRSWKPSQNYIKCPKAFAWMKWLRQDLL